MNDRIYTSAPLNRVAAIVVSNKNCSIGYELDRNHLVEHDKVIMKRISEIKKELGITKRSTWKNIRYKMNTGSFNRDWFQDRGDMFRELVNLCDSHKRINDRIVELKQQGKKEAMDS